MTTPHKWAHVIKAWADGKTIQFRSPTSPNWSAPGYPGTLVPAFETKLLEWRVPVLHQDAWDHYAAGGKVECLGPFSGHPTIWTNPESSRLRRLQDDRWDDKSFKFTIVPKEVVVTAFVELEATIFDSDFRDGVKHNLKLTFNSDGKLLKAEVIG